MSFELTPEQVESNWNRYCTFFDQICERSEDARRLIEGIGSSLSMAPASSKKQYHCAFVGGLVYHSLGVLKNAIKLKKALGYDVPNESLIIGCLFHDLGKACHVDEMGNVIDYYVPNDSEWAIEKYGEVFKINDKIPFMTVPHRSLFLCQKFGFKLTYDETLAILLNDGQFVDENKPYRGCKEPTLATLVHIADYTATREEKEQYRNSL